MRTKFIGEYFKKIRFVGRNFSRPVSRHVASCVAPEIGRNHVQTKRIVRDATFKERRARITQFAHTNILQKWMSECDQSKWMDEREHTYTLTSAAYIIWNNAFARRRMYVYVYNVITVYFLLHYGWRAQVPRSCILSCILMEIVSLRQSNYYSEWANGSMRLTLIDSLFDLCWDKTMLSESHMRLESFLEEKQ